MFFLVRNSAPNSVSDFLLGQKFGSEFGFGDHIAVFIKPNLSRSVLSEMFHNHTFMDVFKNIYMKYIFLE